MAGFRYLILVLLLVIGPRVYAADWPDQGQAYAGCMAASSAANSNPDIGSSYKPLVCVLASSRTYCVARSGLGTCVSSSSKYGYDANHSFPAGTECSTRLDGQAGMINGTLYSGGVCDKGCKVQPNLDPQKNFSIRESGNPNAINVAAGTWRATGEVCSVDKTPAKPEKNDEYCHTTSSGHRVCKSADQTCVSSPSGFRTCAADSSNANGKTEANKPRTEAAAISAPNTPPNAPTNRPGENWQPSGPVTNITNNNTGTTNNTQNYTNQGTGNTGEPVAGDGSSGGGNGSGGTGGEGEGSGNGASGGGDCNSPPATTGDPVLGMIATQTWATRCATEKANAAKVTGDIGDCSAAFSVEGDSVQANQLRAQRAQLCAGKPGEGQGSSGDVHQGAEDADGPGTWTWKFDEDLIDKSGFGGGACPQLGSLDFGRFGVVSLDGQTWWCPLIAAFRTVMLLLGMFIAFRIVFGD